MLLANSEDCSIGGKCEEGEEVSNAVGRGRREALVMLLPSPFVMSRVVLLAMLMLMLKLLLKLLLEVWQAM